MTAPRTCRDCGAALPPSVRWCLQCYARVQELSPRPRTEGTYVGSLQPETRYSRWRAGPLTFGPAGRIAITVLVVLFGSGIVVGGFNPASLWFLSGYVTAATLILKQTWTKVRIPDADAEAESGRPPSPSQTRHPVLFRRVDPRILFGAIGLIAAAAVFGAVRSKGAYELFLPIAALVTLAVGLFLAWLSGI